MRSFIHRQSPAGFDDKAEVQEFEPTALKPTLTIAYRHYWLPTGVRRKPPSRSERSANSELDGLSRRFCILTSHRPTKLLLEPAACKSLKILKVASRALSSLLITEREICGNWAGKRAAAEATLATSLRFSMGERTKKIPTDKGWDFECWWQFEI